MRTCTVESGRVVKLLRRGTSGQGLGAYMTGKEAICIQPAFGGSLRDLQVQKGKEKKEAEAFVINMGGDGDTPHAPSGDVPLRNLAGSRQEKSRGSSRITRKTLTHKIGQRTIGE